MPTPLKILFLAAEAVPFVKVGGLADVAGSLPLALRSLPPAAAYGQTLDVRLALPLHPASGAENATMRPVTEFKVYRRGGGVLARVFESSLDGMPVYFISGDPISASPGVYSSDFAPDREKYAFFSLAALEMLRHMDWRPDLLHANDWHTALSLYALRSRRGDAALERIRTVLTLHNLPYMGGEGGGTLSAYGLAPLGDPSLPAWARSFFLPLGLWAADAIVPVSPSYAREILTPEFGCGLETFLNTRRDSITGILNALDDSSWNPLSDAAIPSPFSASNLEARMASKSALQRALGLPQEERIPLLALVGRLDRQKGPDLAFEAMRRLVNRRWQFVVLGAGDPGLESQAAALQTDFPDRVRAALRYDAPLSRLIYAGADMLLMPSRYEPCGLTQMIAMRYGCVPVVRATGGLRDTVQEGRTGFLFEKAEAADLVEALERALSVFSIPPKWRRYQRNGMSADFSWARSARQYAIIYHSLTS